LRRCSCCAGRRAAVVAERDAVSATLLAPALLAVGVVHGMAFAESIIDAEATPIAAYLLGIATVELALAGTAAAPTLAMLPARQPRELET
jgi:urease accessory protein